MPPRKDEKAPTTGKKPQTSGGKKEGPVGKEDSRKKRRAAPSAATGKERAEKGTERREKVERKRRGRLSSREEQAVLTGFSRGESLRQVLKGFGRERHEEVRDLRKAFEAGEFTLKDGVWQLVS
jgi:hypothetical protein